MLAFCPCLDLSTSAPLARYACSWGWQNGGGLYIWGTATLTNTNVYANQADTVCSPFEPSVTFHLPAGTLRDCAHGWQRGGGLYIWGTATLTNTNVYENQAGEVCLHVELSLRCHPAPRCRAVLKFDP